MEVGISIRDGLVTSLEARVPTWNVSFVKSAVYGNWQDEEVELIDLHADGLARIDVSFNRIMDSRWLTKAHTLYTLQHYISLRRAFSDHDIDDKTGRPRQDAVDQMCHFLGAIRAHLVGLRTLDVSYGGSTFTANVSPPPNDLGQTYVFTRYLRSNQFVGGLSMRFEAVIPE